MNGSGDIIKSLSPASTVSIPVKLLVVRIVGLKNDVIHKIANFVSLTTVNISVSVTDTETKLRAISVSRVRLSDVIALDDKTSSVERLNATVIVRDATLDAVILVRIWKNGSEDFSNLSTRSAVWILAERIIEIGFTKIKTLRGSICGCCGKCR